GRRFVALAVISLKQGLRYSVFVRREIMKERIPQCRLLESALNFFSTDTAFGISLKRRTSLLAEHEFDLAKLMRLKSAPRFKAIAKRQEVEGRDCFEHVDLRDQGLEDRENTLERGACKRRVVRPQ